LIASNKFGIVNVELSESASLTHVILYNCTVTREGCGCLISSFPKFGALIDRNGNPLFNSVVESTGHENISIFYRSDNTNGHDQIEYSCSQGELQTFTGKVLLLKPQPSETHFITYILVPLVGIIMVLLVVLCIQRKKDSVQPVIKTPLSTRVSKIADVEEVLFNEDALEAFEILLVQDGQFDFVNMLGECTSNEDGDEVAKNLTNLFCYHNKLLFLVKALVTLEVKSASKFNRILII
jgi:hypothetical protein